MEKKSILIIDDDPLTCTVIKNHLRNSIYTSTCLRKGAMALELLFRTPDDFSLIFLDRVLPDIDSSELLKSLKTHPTLRAIPVIMITANAEKSEKINAFQNGIYDLLMKPLDKKLLLLVIKRALEDSRNLVLC